MGVEDETEICVICNFFTFILYRLAKMYISTLNIWTTYDESLIQLVILIIKK